VLVISDWRTKLGIFARKDSHDVILKHWLDDVSKPDDKPSKSETISFIWFSSIRCFGDSFILMAVSPTLRIVPGSVEPQALDYIRTQVTPIRRVARWYFGGIASTMAVCITHPLDLLKVDFPVFWFL
jgi:hypothetical protein